jgi:hypothetical protein
VDLEDKEEGSLATQGQVVRCQPASPTFPGYRRKPSCRQTPDVGNCQRGAAEAEVERSCP